MASYLELFVAINRFVELGQSLFNVYLSWEIGRKNVAY